MNEFLLPAAVIGGLVLASWPLGRYMRWAMEPAAPGPARRRYDDVIVRVLGPRAAGGQDWKAYSLSLLVFNTLMFGVVYVIYTTQHLLPLNPDGKGPLEPSLAFNTAASFTTSTNLQHYSGEQALSHFTQIAGIMWLQFVSAATGIAALAARAPGRAGRPDLGNI